ncbi:uncharacterized protein LOC131439989 [Malaya genurostris]|uniref:uncharacterized protein LOC131439988 n=1 Tax=Malaya genurostris TaxID=325434 RepID=UPI0026F3A974|nr:uncharacterized protein LOC131439988 [Malaya genurostris]XP_058467075.1 uncharacterized protein LOC131439989 [Malaya genurostris]
MENCGMPIQKRGRNFGPQDDQQLCKSWITISEDPVKGTDQSVSIFWTAIKNDGNFHSRTTESLRQRWGIINRAVSKFTGCYKSISSLNESGTNSEDVLQKSLDLHKREQKEDFKHMECWEVLKVCPKFNIHNATQKLPGTKTAELFESTTTKRPIGRNSAKKAIIAKAFEYRRADALERIDKATERKATLFEVYTTALKQQNRLRVATARLDELDAVSQKILRIEKQRLLTDMSADLHDETSISQSSLDIEEEPEENMFEEYIEEDI